MPKKTPQFLEYFLEDCLNGNSEFFKKSMFSGYGIYKNGKIFAIYAMGELYFKVGENNIKYFEERNSKIFEYKKKDRIAKISYYILPEEILENREELDIWIERSLEVENKTKNFMQKTKPSFSLKDQLFNKQKVEYISGLIKKVYPDFLDKKFEKEVLEKFPQLELKQRISHISDMLKKYILDKTDFEISTNILIKSLPEVIENGEMDNNFGDFIFCPYSDFVRKNGCNKKDLDFSLNSLEKITSNFSCEDAIRYFLNEFETETFKKMLEWSKSDNYHLRRLASEGSRAKLPWCQKINLNYRKTIKILDNLYQDKSRFVTRSVANHLNDISKIDSDLVTDVLEKWKNKISGQTHRSAPTEKLVGVNLCVHPENDLDYIISHSTRTLVKAGDKRTLEFLGYSANSKVEVENFEIKIKKVKIGENLEFSFDINLQKPENLIIDYKIYFQNKAGKLLPKVFKIKKINSLSTEDFNPLKKEVIQIIKKHKLKIMSTKALYSGEHFVEIIINGKSFGKKEFELI